MMTQYRGGRSKSELVARARDARQDSTIAEAVMWQMLRACRFMDLKFRRQHQFLNFILDFYCDELKLAIELDGAPHFVESIVDRDNRRTEHLQEHGVTVIRIENNELLTAPDAAFDRLRRIVNGLKSRVS